MIIKDAALCKDITSSDNTIIREVLHPIKDNIDISYSLAQGILKPGVTSRNHKLVSSEVYIINEGEGVIYVNGKSDKVKAGQIVFIPANSYQKIKNTGKIDLVFLCVVQPAWNSNEEKVF